MCKRLPPLAAIYLIAEFELSGLCVNFSQSKLLLAKLDFDCTVEYLALTYIIKSKFEPVSARIKRLLLSTHS